MDNILCLSSIATFYAVLKRHNHKKWIDHQREIFDQQKSDERYLRVLSHMNNTRLDPYYKLKALIVSAYEYDIKKQNKYFTPRAKRELTENWKNLYEELKETYNYDYNQIFHAMSIYKIFSDNPNKRAYRL
uniref:Uncharacterized protein n=1 Tax=viral metagenome TaxID=1070528 RepID=A0A6C0LI17_9ZZZZ